MRCRGIILCAGESTRMGRPKALLELGGMTFLERVVHAMEKGGVAEVVVVVGGRDGDRIREAGLAGGGGATRARFVENPDPSPGPISSVRAGIAAEGGAGLERPELYMTHPVDIPGVEPADIAALLDGAVAAPEADALVASVEMRRAHPVLLRESLAARLLGSRSPPSLRELLRDPAVTVHHVGRRNRGLLFDVDTPEDHARIRGELGRGWGGGGGDDSGGGSGE